MLHFYIPLQREKIFDVLHIYLSGSQNLSEYVLHFPC